ncbi:MAG TPA: flagellar biosynthetic protein FliQ [Bryobacteraceae bacterium]|nr:flagellar biosynthetic protein FliQ [Bryobacteraceae bacterium]
MAIHVVTQALMAAFWICAPLLIVAFAVGIIVNLIQIATSLQDPVFSTVPRLAACLGALLLLMPWMLKQAAGFTVAILRDFAQYAR